MKSRKATAPFLTRAASVLLTCVTVLTLTSCFTPKSPEAAPNSVVYVKDNALYYRDIAKESAQQISDKDVEGYTFSEWYETSNSSTVSRMTQCSKDGKRLFFPWGFTSETDYDRLALYCRMLDDPTAEPILIGESFMHYYINDDGTSVLYFTNDNALCLYDFETTVTLAENVKHHQPRPDLSLGIYTTEENELFLWQAGKEAVKLASNVSGVQMIAHDFSYLYYFDKEFCLYRQPLNGEDGVQITTKQTVIHHIYENGDMYYSVSNGNTTGSLYFYTNGRSEALLSDFVTIRSPWIWSLAEDAPAMTVGADQNGDFKHFLIVGNKVTEISEGVLQSGRVSHDAKRFYYIELDHDIEGGGERPLYAADITKDGALTNITKIDDGVDWIPPFYNELLLNTQRPQFSESVIYYKEKNEETGTADLYYGGEKIASDVYRSSLLYHGLSEASFLFCIAQTDTNGVWQLYQNGNVTTLADNVFMARTVSIDDTAFLFVTDWNPDTESYTLHLCKNGTVKTIAENVYKHKVIDGEIYYMKDFHQALYYGTLCHFDGENSVVLDEKVTALIGYYNPPTP